MMQTTKTHFRLALLLSVIIGLGVRLALVIASGWRIDYDEAMIGLLALRVLRGEFMAFIPGQVTLGAGEAYLLAPLFTVFGATVITFRVYSLLCSAAFIVTTGWLGHAAFGARVGAVAVLLTAIAPPYAVIVSLKTWGATVETMILGNLLLLITFHITEAVALKRPFRYQSMAWLGLIAGLMFWMAWLGFYYYLPAGFVLLWRGRQALRKGWWVALAAFTVGSAPLWLHGLTYGPASFTQSLTSRRTTLDEVWTVGEHFTRVLIPQLVTGDSHWGIVGGFWTFILLLGYGMGIVRLFSEAFRQRRAMQIMLALLVITIPVIYVFSLHSRNALNPWEIDATGRYVVMLHSVLPIGVGSLISLNFRRGTAKPHNSFGIQKFVTAALIGGILSVNLAGVVQMSPQRAFDSPYYDRLPFSLDSLVIALDEEGITHLWTDTGIAHVLMFQTHERILAADWYDAYIAKGPVRFPDVLQKVENAPSAAFVVPVAPGQADPPLIQAFDAAQIGYRTRLAAPNLLLIIPAERVDPAQVAAGLGYQY